MLYLLSTLVCKNLFYFIYIFFLCCHLWLFSYLYCNDPHHALLLVFSTHFLCFPKLFFHFIIFLKQFKKENIEYIMILMFITVFSVSGGFFFCKFLFFLFLGVWKMSTHLLFKASLKPLISQWIRKTTVAIKHLRISTKQKYRFFFTSFFFFWNKFNL